MQRVFEVTLEGSWPGGLVRESDTSFNKCPQSFFSKYYHALVEPWWNASGHWAPVTCIVVTHWAATWARGSDPAWSSENFRQQKSRQIKSHLFIKLCFYLIKWKEWWSVWGPPSLRAVNIWSTAVTGRNVVIMSNSSQRATSTAAKQVNHMLYSNLKGVLV